MAQKPKMVKKPKTGRNHDDALHAWATAQSAWTARAQAWIEDAHQRLHDLDHQMRVIPPPPSPPPTYPPKRP